MLPDRRIPTVTPKLHDSASFGSNQKIKIPRLHQQLTQYVIYLACTNTDNHVTFVSCEPAAPSRPAAEGGAKTCRQSASHSLAAREPGVTVRRPQVAPANESRRARFALLARLKRLTEWIGNASPQPNSHWPTRSFARCIALIAHAGGRR
jgi:hypothetical protein